MKIKLTWETKWQPPFELFDVWVDMECDVHAWSYVFETDVMGTYVNKRGRSPAIAKSDFNVASNLPLKRSAIPIN